MARFFINRPIVAMVISITTVPDIVNAISQQYTLSPSGQFGGPPAVPGTEFTYTVRTQGRLLNEQEFGEIIVRSNPDGSQVRLRGVARIEHGMSPKEATYKAREEVSGPVVAIALILAAVFVPVGFMCGISGMLYQQFAIAANALSVLLGKPPSAITRSAMLKKDELPPQIPSRLPAQLIERRPDIVQARQLLVASNANIGVAKALFYPTFSLTGSLGTVSNSPSDFLSADSIVWSLGAGLFQPTFDGGRIKQSYEAALARYDFALAQYQKAALNGYREVADSLVTIRELAEQRTETEGGVEALRDATQPARAR